jgi:hypothetical protein
MTWKSYLVRIVEEFGRATSPATPVIPLEHDERHREPVRSKRPDPEEARYWLFQGLW